MTPLLIGIVVALAGIAVLLMLGALRWGPGVAGPRTRVPRIDLPDGRYVPGPNEEVPPPWANDDAEPGEVTPCDYQGQCLLPTEPPPEEAS